MRPPILATAVLALLAATTVLAQDYQRTPIPETPAIDRTWYRDAEPLFFAGDLYYATGPTVYFNRDTMVPTGAYDGITLYADTTIEPYTIVFVPVADQLMRPYERVQEGYLPPRTANRTYYPPAQEEPETWAAEAQPREHRYGEQRREIAPMPEGPEAAFQPFLAETARKPLDNLGIWVSFQGYRWTHAGEAVPLDAARMSAIADYYGRQVYADPHTPHIIYIPSRANLVAPFRRAE